jgi:hypothetical protein
MKRNLLLFAFALLGGVANAQVIYETNFAADTAARNLTGQAGWSNNSSTGYPGAGACAGAICTNAQVTTTALTATVPYNFAAPKSVSFTSNQDAVAHFIRGRGNVLPDTATYAGFASGAVYASMMVRLSDAPNSLTTGQLFRFADKNGTVGMRLYAQKNAAGALRFGVEKNGGSGSAGFTNYDYAFNTTYVIVLKQEIIAGTLNDRVSIFVNPVGVTEPAALAAATTGDDIVMERFIVYQNQATCPTGNFSALRIARTWADLGLRSSSTQNLTAGKLVVKPTLANNQVTIEMQTSVASSVRVLDISGRVVCTATLQAAENQKTIDISPLSNGMYVLQVVNENGVASQKFVKQ